MKHLKLGALLLAASLFTGVGVSTLSACDTCGCSDAKKEMQKPACDKKGCDKSGAQSKDKKACDSK